MNIRELRHNLIEAFTDAGIAQPEADAELLIGHVTGARRGQVQAQVVLESAIASAHIEKILRLAEDRAQRVPLQHLTGTAPFRHIELAVGPGVFVPRPETEIVVQHALDSISDEPHPVVFELCTGSGAIALAIASETPHAEVWAWEKSVEAHAWAQRNVAKHGDGRVRLHLGDIIELLSESQNAEPPLFQVHTAPAVGTVHVLVSNPPYVPTGMVPKDPEVRDHDPELALYSGADGLDLIRVISKIGRQYVASGGSIVLEHAEMQGAAIRQLLEKDGWVSSKTHQDLTGRDRCTTAHSPYVAAAS